MRSAKCGMRNGKGRSFATRRLPLHSAFHIPNSALGGALARTPRVGRAHRALFHARRPVGRGGGGLVRLSRLRAARVTVSREVARAARRDALPRGAGGALPLLLERASPSGATR